jgi:hypothetical protein
LDRRKEPVSIRKDTTANIFFVLDRSYLLDLLAGRRLHGPGLVVLPPGGWKPAAGATLEDLCCEDLPRPGALVVIVIVIGRRGM